MLEFNRSTLIMPRRRVPTVNKQAPTSEAKLRADQRVLQNPPIPPEEEAVLSGITESGQFTLEKAVNMYAGIRRLRSPK